MSTNAAASVAELPAKKPLPIGEATIKGRLQLYRRPQGNSQYWENLIILPAPDEYSSPATVLVLASRRLGERDDDVTVRVRIGGYRSAGVQLTVEPRIFEELIVAKVSQEISSFAVTTTSGIDSPTMMKRSASTVIDLRPGEVVALAGLDETRETSTRSGLSWLPFDFSRSGSNARSQILLFLQAEAS
mgnify:CR=1 FL=1